MCIRDSLELDLGLSLGQFSGGCRFAGHSLQFPGQARNLGLVGVVSENGKNRTLNVLDTPAFPLMTKIWTCSAMRLQGLGVR